MSGSSIKKINAEIRDVYRQIADRVEERLAGFRRIWESGDDTALFVELAFCLLTPGSGAQRSALALDRLKESGDLFFGGFDDICPELNIVRFKNNKTRYLMEAREKFWKGGGSMRNFLLGCSDTASMRTALVREVTGIGYKEASHFLRNIGLGEDLAILDRHVLRVMTGLGLTGWHEENAKSGSACAGAGPAVRRAIPESISSGRRYCELEESLRRYAKRAGIPMGHLDFVIFYRATGEIFK